MAHKSPKQIRQCFRCHSFEHLTNTCPKIICARCKKPGHAAHHCPELKCYICEGFGHCATICEKKTTYVGSKLKCHRCQEIGHIATICKKKPVCVGCGAVGYHGTDYCPISAFCSICERFGHITSLHARFEEKIKNPNPEGVQNLSKFRYQSPEGIPILGKFSRQAWKPKPVPVPVSWVDEPGQNLGEPGQNLGEPGQNLGEPALYVIPTLRKTLGANTISKATKSD